MTKRQNGLIIGTFLLMIFGFTVGSIVVPEKEFSEKENRVLQQMPKLDLESVFSGVFSEKYEKYLSDQFFGRNEWIGAKTLMERLMGKQEANGVYFAKDNYLIESHAGDFSTELARRNVRYVSDFVDTWKEQFDPEHMQVCIVPNAVDILQDKLPAFVENTEEAAYLQMIREEIDSDYVLDLEPLLQEHKDDAIYYHTDHHWTTYASRLAYEAWAKKAELPILQREAYDVVNLTEDFFGTVDAKVNIALPGDCIEAYIPKEKIAYTLTFNHQEQKDTLYDESFLDTRDKYAVFFGGNQPLIQAETKADSNRKLLILKDSYANCFLTFAMQDLQSIDIVDLRYFSENLNDYMTDGRYTDVLLLYNASGFATDASIAKLALATGQEE